MEESLTLTKFGVKRCLNVMGINVLNVAVLSEFMFTTRINGLKIGVLIVGLVYTMALLFVLSAIKKFIPG